MATARKKLLGAQPLDNDVLLDVLRDVQRDSSSAIPWRVATSHDEAWADRLKAAGVQLVEGDQCWLWLGRKAKHKAGKGGKPATYRRPSYERKGYRFIPYRAILMTYLGKEFPSSVQVDHWCDEPFCVRPGTHHCIPATDETNKEHGKLRKGGTKAWEDDAT